MTPLRATGRRVLEALRDHGALTRSRIAELTGLPRPTVVTAVAALQGSGLVTVDQVEQVDQETRRGRPSSTVDLAWVPDGTLLVDWQRPVVSVSTLRPSDLSFPRTDGPQVYGTPTSGLRAPATTSASTATTIPHDALHTAESLAAAIRAAWTELLPDAPLRRVVVSTPAPVQHDGVRSFAVPGTLLGGNWPAVPSKPVPDWMAVPEPGAALAAVLGCPVVLENDANVAALGEVADHSDPVHANALVVSIKDGVGAGLVLDGRLHRGADGIAGELAHLQVNPNGRICVCGGRGCLITELSDGPLFATEISAAYGHDVTLPDVYRLVAAGDPGVLRVVSDVGVLIGAQIASAVAWLNLDTVVVDGALGPAAEVVADAVRSEVRSRVTPRVALGVTVRVGLPDGLARRRGAAVIARRRFAEDALASHSDL